MSTEARRVVAHPHGVSGFHPPHSVEAEQATLGALMLDNRSWHQVAGRVVAADFYRRDHRLIFESITELAGKGEPFDAVTLSERLDRKGLADDTGGLVYLAGLVRDTPSAANVRAYADVVRERSTLRRVRELGEQITRSVDESSGRSAGELIADAAQLVMHVQTNSRPRGLIDSAQLTGELIDDLDKRSDGARGLHVGLADFDGVSNGLEPGDLVVIAGRPGMGKTALLVSIAEHVSQSNGVATFSAEMTRQQLARRHLAHLSSITQGRLRRAERLDDADWKAVTDATGIMRKRNLWVDDTSAPTLQHIRAETLALKARASVGLVMVDYVQLVQGSGANRYEQLRDVAYGLKALAKDVGVPIILLAQLNRGVESRDHKRPHLSDLRDSGAIEEAADIVGMLYAEGYYNAEFVMPYVLELQIQKNRNGERGECLWHFAGEHSRVTVLSDGARAEYKQLRIKARRRGASDDL